MRMVIAFNFCECLLKQFYDLLQIQNDIEQLAANNMKNTSMPSTEYVFAEIR